MITFDQLKSALENIYISPLELCNLNCRLCYTNKTKNILTNDQILAFIDKYQHYLQDSTFKASIFESVQYDSIGQPKKFLTKKLKLKSILFCGGEVFTLKTFPDLINNLQTQNIFISIITNGTINRLDEIKDPHNCQLLVSLDGPESIHDQNRGPGNFKKTISFINSALQKGFPVEIMYLVTPESYPYLNTFNVFDLKNNFITVKSKFFNSKLDNPSLTSSQIINIKNNYSSIPSKNFGCFQLSLQSDGLIYGCCESPYSLGKITDNPKIYVDKFIKSLKICTKCTNGNEPCLGCTAPDFLCGYKQELKFISCRDVVKSFNAK